MLPRLGVSAAGKITRSHIVIAKGGKVQDVRIKVGPLVSVEEAVKTVTGADAGTAATAGGCKRATRSCIRCRHTWTPLGLLHVSAL